MADPPIVRRNVDQVDYAAFAHINGTFLYVCMYVLIYPEVTVPGSSTRSLFLCHLRRNFPTREREREEESERGEEEEKKMLKVKRSGENVVQHSFKKTDGEFVRKDKGLRQLSMAAIQHTAFQRFFSQIVQ